MAADKAYDTADFVADCRKLGVTPHVAQNTTRRRSAIDGRTTRHTGHGLSQRSRPRIEEPFGWIKTFGGGRKLRYVGRERSRAWFFIAGATYNLIRLAALDAQAVWPTGRHRPTGGRRTAPAGWEGSGEEHKGPSATASMTARRPLRRQPCVLPHPASAA